MTKTTRNPQYEQYTTNSISIFTSKLHTLAVCTWYFVTIVLFQLFVFVPKNIPRPDLDSFKFYAMVFPFLLIAMIGGHYTVKKLPVLLFKKIVAIMLGLGGLDMIVTAIYKLL